jgi:hypothetical protein
MHPGPRGHWSTLSEGCDAPGGHPAPSSQVLTISGANFGSPVVGGARFPANHSIWIGGQPCGSVSWLSDTTLSCRLGGAFPVGSFNVSVVVAGRAEASSLGSRPALLLQCPPRSVAPHRVPEDGCLPKLPLHVCTIYLKFSLQVCALCSLSLSLSLWGYASS